VKPPSKPELWRRPLTTPPSPRKWESPQALPKSLTKPISELESLKRKSRRGPETMTEHDRKVPPGIMLMTHHYHNLIYIRHFWEEQGQQTPKWVGKEMARMDKILQQELEFEEGQGGLLRGDENETRKK
jgi:hypothetical protein